MDTTVWVPPVLSKNRDRLLDHGPIHQIFRSVVEQARAGNLLSEEHFSMDGADYWKHGHLKRHFSPRIVRIR